VTDGAVEFDIVCGARNMAAATSSRWRSRAVLPNGVEIRKAKIRGKASEACSARSRN
jgi:hypothetical protein